MIVAPDQGASSSAKAGPNASINILSVWSHGQYAFPAGSSMPCGSSAGQSDLLKRDLWSRSQMETARAGTGEVARIIRSSTFQPREAAFTKLIQACVPSHDWQKALELWDVMRATPRAQAQHHQLQVGRV